MRDPEDEDMRQMLRVAIMVAAAVLLGAIAWWLWPQDASLREGDRIEYQKRVR